MRVQLVARLLQSTEELEHYITTSRAWMMGWTVWTLLETYAQIFHCWTCRELVVGQRDERPTHLAR